MATKKKYEPHCPAQDCTGGREGHLHAATAEDVRLTPEVLARQADKVSIYLCDKCGFVWFQKPSSRPGFDPAPAGWWDNVRWPHVFHSAPFDLEIREENTRSFWEKHFSKLKKRRARGSRR
jgi:hypothetical protein